MPEPPAEQRADPDAHQEPTEHRQKRFEGTEQAKLTGLRLVGAIGHGSRR